MEHLQSKEDRSAKTVREYFSDLGFTLEGLQGKRTLDIGAGAAEFARYANARGANVTSVDMGKYLRPEELSEIAGSGVPYVRASAVQLPFPDNSFDVVISHNSMPNITDQQPAIELAPDGTIIKNENPSDNHPESRLLALKEAVRVLKTDGEIRLANVVAFRDERGGLNRQAREIREAIEVLRADPELQIIEESIPRERDIFRLVIRRRGTQKS